MTNSPTISVIVPVLNEREHIDRLIAQLAPLREEAEIIVVDGGSTDGTREALAEHFTVIDSLKGRGTQLNTGARAATGDVLFFLHADAELPEDPLGQIRDVMKNHRVGCFGLKFDSKHPMLRMCGHHSNFRAFGRRIIFGDQGMFIDRDLFLEQGGFPEIPLMEDYQFSLDLRKRGYKVGRTRKRLKVSPRWFGDSTRSIWHNMWQLPRFRRAYLDGMPMDQLVAEYRQAREEAGKAAQPKRKKTLGTAKAAKTPGVQASATPALQGKPGMLAPVRVRHHHH